MNVIKQVVVGSGDEQTIKMIVRDSERGPKGEQGDKGDAATITAGEAYSVAPNLPPAVMNTGTSSNAVFDFYIPRGEKGDTGAPGAPGADGKDGKDGVDGKDGKDGADGKDGVVQYTAGDGITISNDVISTTSRVFTTAEWSALWA